jgi:hypothetical protein
MVKITKCRKLCRSSNRKLRTRCINIKGRVSEWTTTI